MQILDDYFMQGENSIYMKQNQVYGVSRSKQARDKHEAQCCVRDQNCK